MTSPSADSPAAFAVRVMVAVMLPMIRFANGADSVLVLVDERGQVGAGGTVRVTIRLLTVAPTTSRGTG